MYRIINDEETGFKITVNVIPGRKTAEGKLICELRADEVEMYVPVDDKMIIYKKVTIDCNKILALAKKIEEINNKIEEI